MSQENLQIYNNKLEQLQVIIKGKHQENTDKAIISYNLYSIYDFTNLKCSGKCIIMSKDIENVRDKKFSEVDFKTVEVILELAEKCEIDEKHEFKGNFIVYANGKIRLGGNMSRIKTDLRSIKEIYQQYLVERCEKENNNDEEEYSIMEIKMK